MYEKSEVTQVAHTHGHLLLTLHYLPGYDGGSVNAEDPLNGEPIRRNVFMYIAGSSVNCPAMMNFAVKNLEQITDTVEHVLPQNYRSSLETFYGPLGLSLIALYDQGNRELMLAMRLAMARLVDASMLYLFANEGFRPIFEQEWPELYCNILKDNNFFRQEGKLRQLPGHAIRMTEHTNLLGQAAVIGAVGDIVGVIVKREDEERAKGARRGSV
jgi:hypothetical protein